MIVGLTGGIGSGKTTVANMFKHFNNICVYVADVEAKKLMHSSLKIQNAIVAQFGKAAYTNNTLNSAYLANIVFNNKQQLAKLNAIIHPEVKQHFKTFVANNKSATYIVYESAILFESNNMAEFDVIILVTANLDIRIKRVLKRDNTTKEAVLKRMNNQWPQAKKALQSHYIIENTTLEDTEHQVKRIHNILTKKC